MSDALSKSVPIWCCVINRAIVKRWMAEHERSPKNEVMNSKSECKENEYRFPSSSAPTLDEASDEDWDTRLHLPPFIPSSEEHQISQLIDKWVDELLDSSYVLPTKAEMSKPLRPVWIVQPAWFFHQHQKCEEQVAAQTNSDLPYHPIVLLTASVPLHTLGLQNERRNRPGYTYVQGAGDDHESWSLDLTPELWWKHRDEIVTFVSHPESMTSAGGGWERWDHTEVDNADEVECEEVDSIETGVKKILNKGNINTDMFSQEYG